MSAAAIPGAAATAPDDLARILGGIARTAARFCNATHARIFLRDGDQLRHAHHRGPPPIPDPIADSLPIDRSSLG